MKLQAMGVSHKEQYPAVPKSEKDYEKEKSYLEVHASGKHAELMGAKDLNAGDIISQTVQWKVKSVTKTERDGKSSYELTLCMEKASVPEAVESNDDAEDSEDEGDEEESEKEMSPAMSYIDRISRG